MGKSSYLSIENEIRELMPSLTGVAQNLEGSRILISGGTGFVGKWLISALEYAKKEFSIKFEIDVISRYGRENSPFNSEITDSLNWILKDFTKDTELLRKPYSHYILGSTPSISSKGSSDLLSVRDATINGTRSVLDSIKMQSGLARVINLSSGAASSLEVLEPKFEINECPADHFTNPSANYAHAKLQSEKLILEASRDGTLSGCNLRLYAFAGPLLALDEHFAVGNFMKDALNRMPIRINGNPNTLRSYMYPTDLVRWILKILVSDKAGTFSVGNPSPVSIGELARTISRVTSQSDVIYPFEDGEFTSYYPDTSLTESTFDLTLEVDFETSILNWWTWLNSTNFTQE
jgi:nucleoside-diphosphate-sugar epimerase